MSVIIPCFNAARWIRETLRSVADQCGPDIEVIAVDDGSTDQTAEIVASEFGWVRMIRTPNQGASRARNLGTSAASGEFLQYLDADDLLAPAKLRYQREALERTGADVAYGDWRKLSPSGDGHEPGEIVAREMKDAPELELFGLFWCPPAAYLFRRGIVERTGGWNEGLPVIQDARFALDCALRGGRFVYTPGIVAHYRVHREGSLSSRDPKAFHRDIYRNALEMESWWRGNGGLSGAREDAVVSCLGYVARWAYRNDRGMFEECLGELERVRPGYVPSRPRRLAVASRLVGYRRAEAAAHWYRQAKRALPAIRGPR